MRIEDVFKWDEISITGSAHSPEKRYENLHCVVSTVDRSDLAIKVWPTGKDEDLDGGKIWFPFSGVESVELIYRDEELALDPENLSNPLDR